MPDHETPPAGEGSDPAKDDNADAHGYEYSVVDDDDGVTPGRSGRPMWLLAAAVLLPAIIVGVVVWFIASSVSGGSSASTHTNQDVASILNAFSSQQGTTSTRFEGKLPPDVPSGIPTYPGSKVVSALRQVQGSDASYLVVYDTADARDKVANYFDGKLDADPWQLQGGQSDVNGTVQQFSSIKDPNLSGLVLVSASKDNKVTTILESIQVVSGAASAPKEAYSPGASKPLPNGFPANVPEYPGAVNISTAYQKQPQGNQYIISLVTRDDAAKVLDFYRGKFKDNGWTVADTDPNATPPANGTPT
ncbi:MAG: hypothetical protein ACREMU_09505, partial [Gemmatimonadaceae bacterium]